MSAVYWLARGGSNLAKWTPRSLRERLGYTIGASSYWAWRSKRLVTQLNMAQVTGKAVKDPRVQYLAYASWRNYGRYAADFMNFANITTEDIENSALDVTEGATSWLTYLEQAKQAGRGVIFISAHFGNWDMAGAILARHIAFSAITETFTDERLNTLLQNQRKEKGVAIIPLEGSPRRILRVLQQNQLVGLLVDRPVTPQQGTPVRFFGRTTYVPSGPAALALKSGAAILPGFVWYGPRNQMLVRAFPPIFPQPGGDRHSDIAAVTQRIYDSLEEMIRAWPTQWYMFRQFWPTES
ncbi:MAG TPA: lysophospholipid acyltransferase family protein, partial [Ktedonobacteraceae bacterium]|nr:lysophospholipid acyltransferase family protein [Ktedonobacteraceae bacterium]